MFRLVTFDPGGLTGYSVFERREKSDVAKLVELGSFPTWEGIEKWVKKTTSLIVYEKIVVFNPSFNTIGVEVMGAIQHLCWLRGIPTFPQSPSILRAVFKQGVLPHGLRGDQHAIDAVAHGAVYLRREKVRLEFPDTPNLRL